MHSPPDSHAHQIEPLLLGPVVARLDYANTFADYKEAAASARKRRKRSKWRSGFALLVFIGYGVMGGFYFAGQRWTGPKAPADSVSSNLLLALLPPLLPVLLICTATLHPWKSANAGIKRSVIIRRKVLSALLFATFMTDVGLLMSTMRVDSAPTRGFWLMCSIVPPFALLVFAIVIVAARARGQLAAQWGLVPTHGAPCSLEVTGVGVHYASAIMMARYRWSCFTLCRETETLYVLVLVENRMFMVPKRAFVDSSMEMRFRALITHVLPASTLVPLLSAFSPILPSDVTPQ